MATVAPSILSADFSRLADELASVHSAPWIHVDVMDGRFVPNLTLGPLIVDAVRRSTDRFVDVHLMIVEPEKHIQAFVDAGAQMVTVHAETCDHLHRVVQQIHGAGAKAGVALNPHTPETVLDYVLEELDLVLVMSVNPGWGGQSLIESSLRKINRIREAIEHRGLNTHVEVDGGVKTHNAYRFVDAGADVLVSGSGVFKANDRAAAIAALAAAVRPD
jgi:ribulose-phosphate 3-epimerase